MAVPILLVTGEAGSGKDTVAQFIAEYLNGVSVAQADPMKRFVKDTFEFSEGQLWGPSERRNAPDLAFSQGFVRARVLKQVEVFAEAWVNEVLPDSSAVEFNQACDTLVDWALGMVKSAEKDGGLTPRLVLQTLGTEWGRTFRPNMWVDYAQARAFDLLGGGFKYSRTEGLVEDKNNPGYGLVIISDGRFRNEILGVKRAGGLALKVVDPASGGVNAAEKAGVVGHRSESEQRQVPHHFFDAIFTNDKSKGLGVAKEAVHTNLVPVLFDPFEIW